MMRSLFGRSSYEAVINGKTITVEPDETLLLAALRQDINIPSICRVGGCGTCKCKLKEGQVEELTETAYLLTEKEIADGYILACQSRLRSDVKIDLAQEGAINAAPVSGKIINKQQLTHDIARIEVRLEQAISYRAGQFAEVALPAMSDNARSYSFSSASANGRDVSFTVRRVPGGRVSGHLVDKAKVGDALTVRGPGGQFWMRDDQGPVLMIAGGSGLAPILAMLQDMQHRGDQRAVTVLFGARSQRDLYALDQMADYVAKRPDFRFIPVLSEANQPERWEGRTGLVSAHIAELLGGAQSAYLCGPPAMIDAAVVELRRLGMASEQIHADRFVDQAPKMHTGFYGAVGLPVAERVSANVLDYLKFLLLHAMGAGAVVSLLAGGSYTGLGLLVFLVFYIGGDALMGSDTRTPAYKSPWILTVQLWLALPLLAMVVFSYIWTLSPGDPLGFGASVSGLTGCDILSARAGTSFWQHMAGLLHTGLMIGFLGTVTAHELTHRTWDPISLLCGRWLLAFSYDTGFAIEHVYGHHRYVSTEHDPATAPRGRNVYFHMLASLVKGNISAWCIEAERLKRKHQFVLGYRNAYLRGLLMSVLLLGVAAWMAGWVGALAFSACALFAKCLLEVVNYMEHYGIVRLPDQAVQPRHSWNTNARMSSWAMFNLSRHSHHHAQGEVPYHDLMPLSDAPMMVHGYLATVVLTLIPPLWHRLMTPKLMEWDRVYATPEERALALRANQRSRLKALREYDPRHWNTGVAN